jgi:exo-1,4-beta-D-glucosaminidase
MKTMSLVTNIIMIVSFAFFSCSGIKTDLSEKVPLSDNWFVQRSDKINLSGAEIAGTWIDTSGWYKAKVPSTIMGVLTYNGMYKDVFMGENLKNVDKEQFNKSWWYRKEFYLPKHEMNQDVYLHFDGISYYANIWLNGKLAASRDSVFGTFRTFEFNITNLVRDSNNVLAVEVFRKQPGDFGIGFVDWNPKPPDENMGIWRGVYLKITGDVAVKNTFVGSKVNTETLDEAWLTLNTELINYSSETVKGLLKGKIENTEFNYPVQLNAGEQKFISLTPSQIPALHIKNPRLWWCNNMGEPNLYKLDLQFIAQHRITDKTEVIFGIRQIDDYYNDEGHKGFKLNGRKVLIKGAGWTDDLFLRNNEITNEIEVQYVKHMNLNTIRFEGIWGNSQNIYDLCDQYGILAMVGWSCQWEWDDYLGKPCDDFGGIKSDKDIDLIIKSMGDQICWLQNHPSIFVWMLGSDKLPRPSLEEKYTELIHRIDNRPYLASAGWYKSTVSGSTGVKMNGPYEFEAPNYWYIDSVNGGAFGFNTETGPGPQIPTLETIRKMIPENKTWPINSVWNYHCTSAEEAFNSLDVFNKALNNRYGKPQNLNEYLLKSDAMSYEAMKGMFEAFRANMPNTTGIIQWMLNSAWPSLYWQLYDYYLLPTAAYYASRKANVPLQLIYNYGNNSIDAINESVKKQENLKAKIKILNFKSEVIMSKEIDLNLEGNKSIKIFAMPSVKAIAFVYLSLYDAQNNLISDNFYWLSEKQDEYDWDKTFWAYTPMKGYADFKNLNDLPQSKVELTYSGSSQNKKILFRVKLKNPTERIAFFIKLTLKDEKGNTLYPVFWEDNLVSIIPGASKSVECILPEELWDNKPFKLFVSGWNTEEQSISVRL